LHGARHVTVKSKQGRPRHYSVRKALLRVATATIDARGMHCSVVEPSGAAPILVKPPRFHVSEQIVNVRDGGVVVVKFPNNLVKTASLAFKRGPTDGILVEASTRIVSCIPKVSVSPVPPALNLSQRARYAQQPKGQVSVESFSTFIIISRPVTYAPAHSVGIDAKNRFAVSVYAVIEHCISCRKVPLRSFVIQLGSPLIRI